jgi:hypothetical protein
MGKDVEGSGFGQWQVPADLSRNWPGETEENKKMSRISDLDLN